MLSGLYSYMLRFELFVIELCDSVHLSLAMKVANVGLNGRGST